MTFKLKSFSAFFYMFHSVTKPEYFRQMLTLYNLGRTLVHSAIVRTGRTLVHFAIVRTIRYRETSTDIFEVIRRSKLYERN